MSSDQFFNMTADVTPKVEPVPAVVIASPGNGTTYTIGFLRIPDGACQARGFQLGSYLVSVQPGTSFSRCGIFADAAWGGYLGAGYVAEKLHLGNDPDAVALTKIIAETLGRPY